MWVMWKLSTKLTHNCSLKQPKVGNCEEAKQLFIVEILSTVVCLKVSLLRMVITHMKIYYKKDFMNVKKDLNLIKAI